MEKYFKEAPDGARVEKILVSSIHDSEINPRKETLKGVAELADSIKAKGLLQPILVRKRKGTANIFEVICGNRRLEAHRMLDIEWIDCKVVEMTDDEARDAALIENLQRADLHPMEEAEGIKVLIDKGQKAEDVAARLARPLSFVAQRLKLLDLKPSLRKEYLKGEISHKVAIGLARLSQEQQEDAWSGIYAETDEDIVEGLIQQFSTDLSRVSFDTKDETLVPKAGSCTKCPKRTGNNPGLFEDTKDSLCMDMGCFKGKVKAHSDRQKAEAEKKGYQVIRGSKAVGALAGYSSELVKLSSKGEEDPKRRTYAQLVGKAAADLPKVMAMNEGTTAIVYRISDIAPILKKNGHNFKELHERSTQDNKAKREEERKKYEIELAVRGAAVVQACAKIKPGSKSFLDVLRFIYSGFSESEESVAYAFPEWKALDQENEADGDILQKQVEKATLQQILACMVLVAENSYTHDEGDTNKLLQLDMTKIGNEVKKKLKEWNDKKADEAKADKTIKKIQAADAKDDAQAGKKAAAIAEALVEGGPVKGFKPKKAKVAK